MPPPIGSNWRLPVIALLLIASVAVGGFLLSGRGASEKKLAAAHDSTAVAAQGVAAAEAVVRVDTVERRVVVTRWRSLADSARTHLTDTVLTARALDSGAAVVTRDDSTIARLGRANQAHVVLESALRTELGISERLRTPRFTLSSQIGLDVDAVTPVTGLEASVRVGDHWSLVGRLDKRWVPGEASRRQVLLRYSIGR